MNDKEKRVLDMFRRTRGYGSEHATLTTEGSLSHDLFNTIDSVINELEEHSTVEWEGRGTARQGTVSKAVARAAILEDLGILRRTARTMDSIEPGLEEKFRVPYNGSDEELLIAARAALNAARPYKAEFIRREVREQLFEDLEANIAAFEEALAGQHTGKGASRAAGASIDSAIDRGLDAVRQLDPIVRNKFQNNPAALAAWLSAKRVERAPRRNHTATPPPPQTSNT